MFTHVFTEVEPHQHETVQEARDCEAAIEAWMDPPCCPVCDAPGCGADGNGCRRYEWGTDAYRAEVEADDLRAAMMGAVA